MAKPEPPGDERPDSSIANRVIALVVVGAAFSLLSSILVPPFVALVLAITLAPLTDWFERMGLNRALSSLACLLLLTLALVGTAGLVLYQAGAILQDSDKHIDRIGELVAKVSERPELKGIAATLGTADAVEAPAGQAEPGVEPGPAPEAGATPPVSDPGKQLGGAIRRNAEQLGRYLLRGLGGLLGVLGGLVLMLAFLFYMLLTRHEWVDRLTRAGRHLGMRPRAEALGKIRDDVRTYVSYLAMVSLAYAVVISLALWAIGVPNALLWGVLTGLLEVVPYFGPVVAGALPTLMALSTGSGLWQPAAVIALFAVLQTVEGYVVAPMLYGKAVDIDPVTVLFGVLFFGFLWGPVGLAAAMPLMILIRGILNITPGTPALDALLDAESPGAKAGGS